MIILKFENVVIMGYCLIVGCKGIKGNLLLQRVSMKILQLQVGIQTKVVGTRMVVVPSIKKPRKAASI